MTTSRRWIVRPSGFPFNLPGKPLGSVLAEDRREATKLAEQIFGRQVTVESENGGAPDGGLTNGADDAVARLSSSAMRVMTPIEIQMARALGVLGIKGPAKGTIRRLHAESFKSTPEISDQLASRLRQMVQQHRGQLPTELLESVGAP
jgi:hypothetical protein